MNINNPVRDHDTLTDVTANQHHAQAHNLDTHSVRTHANLQTVTSDQHHAQTHASTHQPSGNDTMAVDAVIATGSLRTLGTGAQQAAPGNHYHGLTLIGTADADDDTDLTIDDLPNTQDSFLIVISAMVPATDNADLWFRVGPEGSIDDGTGEYSYHTQISEAGSANYASEANASSTKINLTPAGAGSATGEGCGGLLTLVVPGGASIQPIITGTMVSTNGSTNEAGGIVIGRRTEAITLERVQVKFSTGNITSGRLTVWGMAHA